MSIKITARHIISKENIAQYQTLAKELVEKSRQEAGWIMYSLNQSMQDEHIHCFIEEWQDQQAINLHNASEHFQRIIPQFAAMFDVPETVELYTEIM